MAAYNQQTYEQAQQMGLGEEYLAQIRAQAPQTLPAVFAPKVAPARPSQLKSQATVKPTTRQVYESLTANAQKALVASASGYVGTGKHPVTYGEALDSIENGYGNPEDFGLGRGSFSPSSPTPATLSGISEMGLLDNPGYNLGAANDVLQANAERDYYHGEYLKIATQKGMSPEEAERTWLARLDSGQTPLDALRVIAPNEYDPRTSFFLPQQALGLGVKALGSALPGALGRATTTAGDFLTDPGVAAFAPLMLGPTLAAGAGAGAGGEIGQAIGGEKGRQLGEAAGAFAGFATPLGGGKAALSGLGYLGGQEAGRRIAGDTGQVIGGLAGAALAPALVPAIGAAATTAAEAAARLVATKGVLWESPTLARLGAAGLRVTGQGERGLVTMAERTSQGIPATPRGGDFTPQEIDALIAEVEAAAKAGTASAESIALLETLKAARSGTLPKPGAPKTLAQGVRETGVSTVDKTGRPLTPGRQAQRIEQARAAQGELPKGSVPDTQAEAALLRKMGHPTPAQVLADFKARPNSVSKSALESALKALGIDDITGSKPQLAAKLNDVLQARATPPVSPEGLTLAPWKNYVRTNGEVVPLDPYGFPLEAAGKPSVIVYRGVPVNDINGVPNRLELSPGNLVTLDPEKANIFAETLAGSGNGKIITQEVLKADLMPSRMPGTFAWRGDPTGPVARGVPADIARRIRSAQPDILQTQAPNAESLAATGTRTAEGAAKPPIPPRKTSVSGGGGGFENELRATNLPDDSQDIVRAFVNAQVKAGESIPKRPSDLRKVQATVTGDLPDQYLTTAARNENQLRNAIVQQEVARVKDAWKVQGIELNKLNPTTRQAVLADIENILQQTDSAVAAFRREVTNLRYTGSARKNALNTLMSRDAALQSQVPNLVDRAQGALKELVLGADLGVVLQQGLRAQRMGITAEASWGLGRVVDKVRKAFGADPQSLGVYTDRSVSPLVQAQADGLIQTGGGAVGLADEVERATQLASGGGSLLNRAKNAPQNLVRKLTDAQYGKLNDLRRIIYEGRLYQAKLLGQDISPGGAARRSAAEYANTAGSAAYAATNPGRALLERRLLLSPQLTRAQFAEMSAPLKTFTSASHALNTANQVASTSATFGLIYAIAEAIGIPITLDEFMRTTANPLSSSFGKIVLDHKDGDGKNLVWNLLPQFSAENALLRSLRSTIKLANGDQDVQQTLEDIGGNIAKYSFGRANIGISDIAKLGGFGYGKNGQFFYGDMPLSQRAKQSLPIPLSVQGAAVEGETDPIAVAINILGGSTYGESAVTSSNRESQPVIQEAIQAGVFPPGIAQALEGATYGDLTSKERQALMNYATETNNQQLLDAIAARDKDLRDRGSVFQEKRDEVTAYWEKQTPRLDLLMDSLFTGGPPADAVKRELDNIRDGAGDFYADPAYRKAIDDLPEKDIYKVLDQYYSIADRVAEQNGGVVDWDKVDELRKAFLIKLGQEDKALADRLVFNLENQADPSAHEIIQLYDKAEPLVKAYYDVSQEDRTAYREENPKVDFLLWLLGYVTTVRSQEAADLAEKATTGREVKLVTR